MDTKTKARDLIIKFHPYTLGTDHFSNASKQCALIAVDEIIKALKPLSPVEGMGDADYEIRDWKKVREEIKQLN